jgi:hypothetical protein
VRSVFLRLLDADDKPLALRHAVHAKPGQDGLRFELDPTGFAVVPNSPFAYWVSDSLRQLFVSSDRLERAGRTARQGLATSDDFRFVRLAVEPSSAGLASGRWRLFAKGGRHAPYYADVSLVVTWGAAQPELEAFGEIKGNAARSRQSSEFYFRPGITWPARASRFAPRALPAGCIFSHRGYSYFPPPDELAASLGLFNSSVFDFLFKVSLGRFGYPEFLVGVLRRLPLPRTPVNELSSCANLARRAWGLRRSLDTRVETSHAFVLPALLQVEVDSLAARADVWDVRMRAVEAELGEIQAEIDERCFDLYGIDEADRRVISEGLGGDAAGVDAEEVAGEFDEAGDEQEVEAEADAAGLAAELVSWAVGVAFGRFDVRFATGDRELPGEPEPFDPLPVCSPAMLVGEDGLPVASRPMGYPFDFPESGVLVDDPGDPRDLTAAVRAVFDVVFGAGADARWDEAAALLDARGHELRAWLRSSFFEQHLRLHSKSRRKAPILWQLGTPSGRYSIWLYAHRLTDDTFFQLQNDVLAPKLAYEERQLTNLVQEARGSASARERRAIEAQESFVEELRLLLEEVKGVAPLWKPTLDDGIVLVMAPLWRPVPHKPWQRELKKKWTELVAGKYDWAQLAMRLWPERVVPKCADDRSLAIAHRLEDTFWVEDKDGNWQPREQPTTAVDVLIRERTSAATKDALGTVM